MSEFFRNILNEVKNSKKMSGTNTTTIKRELRGQLNKKSHQESFGGNESVFKPSSSDAQGSLIKQKVVSNGDASVEDMRSGGQANRTEREETKVVKPIDPVRVLKAPVIINKPKRVRDESEAGAKLIADQHVSIMKKDTLTLKGLGGELHAFSESASREKNAFSHSGELNAFQDYRYQEEQEKNGEIRNHWSSDVSQNYQPSEKQTSKNHPVNKKGWAAIGAAILAVLGKFKALLIIVLSEAKALIGTAKLGGLLTTMSSMVLMIWVHAQIYGFAYALGIVLLIFFHEMGHYFVAKEEKLNVSGPVFIPFVGAVINMKETPRSVEVEAKVALGGPVIGGLAALGSYLIFVKTQNPLFLSLAYMGGLINLFNLIPVRPLDGGRVVAAITPLIWIAGLVGLFGVYLMSKSPLILLITVMGAFQIFSYFKSEDKHYYKISQSKRLIFATLYFSLVIILTLGTMYCFTLLQ